MSTEWYYESMGQVIGPLTSAELLQKVRAGEVTEATPIRKDDSQWVAAEDVNGLFEAANRARIQHKCPYCGHAIPRPPTTCEGCRRNVDKAYRTIDPSYRPPPHPPHPQRDPSPEALDGRADDSRLRRFIRWFRNLLVEP